MNASDQRDRSSRVEREIREILERTDTEPTPMRSIPATIRRRSVAARAHVAGSASRDWVASRMSSEVARIGGALVLAIAAAGISGLSQLVAVTLAIASLLVFFSLWFPSRPSGPGGSRRWRGQDLGDSGPSSPGRNRNKPR